MDTTQLASFLAIARNRSFRRAAQEVHLAQPSLSQQIRRLEAELGVQLFDRSRRPLQLTEPGESLVPRAETILTAIEETLAEFRDYDATHHGSVAVGALQYLAHLELPDLMASFLENNPRTDLRLKIGNTGEVRSMLLDGEVDVALLHGESQPLPERFTLHTLRTERLAVIVARDAPLAGKRCRWADLSEQRYVTFGHGGSIHGSLIEATHAAGYTPRVVLETGDVVTAVAFVSRGFGIALVPESVALREQHRVSRIMITDGAMPRTIVLAWDRVRYCTRATAAFIDHARGFFRQTARATRK